MNQHKRINVLLMIFLGPSLAALFLYIFFNSDIKTFAILLVMVIGIAMMLLMTFCFEHSVREEYSYE